MLWPLELNLFCELLCKYKCKCCVYCGYAISYSKNKAVPATAMISTSVKQNDDFMIEKLNTSRSSLKMTTRLPLQTMSKPPDTKLITTAKSKKHC